MVKYQNKYRIASARAQWWDYGWNGAYFITICTRNRQHYFGNIENGEMHLSPTGILAHRFWYEIPDHSKYIELGEFVVMPNHIHGILIIDKPDHLPNDHGFGMVETGHALSLPFQTHELKPIQPHELPGQYRFQNIGKNTLSSMIAGYKSAVTKYANLSGLENGWQTRFHDHIIRDHMKYQRISNYIINNVATWASDKFYREDDSAGL